MNDLMKGILCGLMMGAYPWGALSAWAIEGDAHLAECEAKILRSQECKLIAVPVLEKEVVK